MEYGKRLPKVAIIGAGVAGICAAKALHQYKIPFDCFDKRNKIGGIWAYQPEAGETSAWYTLHQNSPKTTYQFRDFPIPDNYPDYPSHWHIQAYLENCAKHFGFIDKINLNSTVTKVFRQEDGIWAVTLHSGEVRYYDAVIIANGHHNLPLIPDFPGEFSGHAIHSRDYRERDFYKNKNVLVVGFGNSGSQIAVDVSYSAKKTLLSIRRGGYVVPHFVFGKRLDKFYRIYDQSWFYRLFPWPLSGMLLTLAYRLTIGGTKQFGVPKPDHYFGDVIPTISENLLNRIGDGDLVIKANIASFEGQHVNFIDGSQETVDAIIYCTGYKTIFPFLDEKIFAAKNNEVHLYKRIFLPGEPSLCFIGLFQSTAFAFLPIMEVQGELIARYFAGLYHLPSAEEMQKDIMRDQKIIKQQFVNSSRNKYQMNGPLYQRDCHNEMKKGNKRAAKQLYSLPVTARAASAQTINNPIEQFAEVLE